MRVLVVVDMQNDFIDGVLGTPEARAIVPNVVEKIKEYANSKDLIVYTKDTHEKDYLNTTEGKKLPVPHCIIGTEGWEIPKYLLVDHPHVARKFTFGSDYLPMYIDDLTDFEVEPESIELVGLCTDICVISNAMILKAYYPESQIIVDSSCCAGTTPESHIRALEAMKMCHIDIV